MSKKTVQTGPITIARQHVADHGEQARQNWLIQAAAAEQQGAKDYDRKIPYNACPLNRDHRMSWQKGWRNRQFPRRHDGTLDMRYKRNREFAADITRKRIAYELAYQIGFNRGAADYLCNTLFSENPYTDHKVPDAIALSTGWRDGWRLGFDTQVLPF